MGPGRPRAGSLGGRRLLVVGASAGIGRATAVAAAVAGARVVAVARRADRLADLPDEAQGIDGAAEIVGIVADVALDGAPARAVGQAAEALGGLDAVIYTAAQTHLAEIDEVEDAVWHRLFAVNVIGASATLSAAREHLAQGWGRAILVTSDSVGHPFPGLGAYVATKAALGSVVGSWQVEHPELATALVTVGPTATDAAAAWDQEAMARFFPRWVDEGYVRPDLVPARPEDVARQLLGVLSSEPFPAEVDLAPPRPWA